MLCVADQGGQAITHWINPQPADLQVHWYRWQTLILVVVSKRNRLGTVALLPVLTGLGLGPIRYLSVLS